MRQESDDPFLIRLATPFGPLAVACRDGVIERLWLPDLSQKSLDQKLAQADRKHWRHREGTQLAHDLARYFRGEGTPLSYAVNENGLTPFARDVFAALREVRWGEIVSYGALALRIGRPRAARAIGGVMARNKIPLILPCHRVVGRGGMGGFSGPGGATLKKKLLAHEGCDLAKALRP